MRITREKLVELARRETEHRATIKDIISGYVIGSVARSQPLLGGAADIDLILIHDEQPSQTREIVQLSDQVHLDIEHHPRELYAKPRELRVHPWLGPSMCEPIFIYDPEHYFEWAQAGARGQFFRADHVYARASALLERSRQTWSLLSLSNRWVKSYARAVMEAANAVACLSGFPVAGRSMMLELERTVEDLGYPEVYDGFLRTLGVDSIENWDIPEILSAWAQAFDLASEHSTDPDIAPCRRTYFLSGFHALVETGRPDAILWTLITTWERAINILEDAGIASPHMPSWEAVLDRLRLSLGASATRAEDLEHFQDQMEQIVETWADQSGA